MKEIIAIIRMTKMNETKQALADMGVASVTARKVMGRGVGKVDYLLLQGAQEGYEEAINQIGPGPKLIPKRMLNLIVPAEMVEPIVKKIISINQTKNPGDGKVFVMPISDAVRLRTGETGESAIDEIAVS